MVNFKKSDLKYEYEWKASQGDNEKITGFPDNILLSRKEGYEVLPFINRYMASIKWENLSSFQKIEKLIQTDLPGTIRSHKKVAEWLTANLSNK